MDKQHYLTFWIGREWYGVDVNMVIEVLHFVALSELPASAPDVLGVMTLRDRVMPVVDLRRRFGADDTSIKLDTPIIAIHTHDGHLGLVVDRVDGVEQVAEAQIMPYDQPDQLHINRIARIENRLLFLVNPSFAYSDTPMMERIGTFTDVHN